jgi:drug/metabolite transporter (DMT)-like permease
LSLGAALFWGGGDYVGGITARKTDALGMVVFAHLGGGLLALIFAFARQSPMPAPSDLVWAAVAGSFGGLALAAFYHALAIGKMGINSALSGMLTAAIPVAAGALWEGMPRQGQLVGFVLAIASIVLVSQPGEGNDRSAGYGYALAAGLGFGIFLLLLRLGTRNEVFWPLAVARFASSAFTFLVCVLRKRSWVPISGTFPGTIGAGVLDTFGVAMFAFAAQLGRMDVAAVLASLYPAVTVVLARVLLKEYLTRVQSLGVIAGLIAIALIAR